MDDLEPYERTQDIIVSLGEILFQLQVWDDVETASVPQERIEIKRAANQAIDYAIAAHNALVDDLTRK